MEGTAKDVPSDEKQPKRRKAKARATDREIVALLGKLRRVLHERSVALARVTDEYVVVTDAFQLLDTAWERWQKAST